MDRGNWYPIRVALYLVCQQRKDHQLLIWSDLRDIVRRDLLSDQLYASLLLQLFFFGANIYGWYAWSKQTPDNQAELKIRWLSLPKALAWAAVCIAGIVLMTLHIDTVFAWLTRVAVTVMQSLGANVQMPELQPDAFPFWDSTMMVLSIAAMILMTRKYVENWLIWVVIDVISVAIFAYQGVYAMALEYAFLTLIALNGSWLWIKSAARNHSRPLSTQG
ncbi:intergral membrane NMN transport protein PnuC [Yersinia pestis D182038]|nr:intergral membrane NMN transport protein PnuC [Yersinia pestis D182038]